MPTLGVDVPLAGPDGAQGILALQAVRFALADSRAVKLDVRDASGGGFADPHEDEGAGDWRNPTFAAKNIAAFAANGDVIAVIGGFNTAVGRAEMRAAQRAGVPIVLADQVSQVSLSASERKHFETAYRRHYGEAPDALAERFYAATKLILSCGGHSRAELIVCLRRGPARDSLGGGV